MDHQTDRLEPRVGEPWPKIVGTVEQASKNRAVQWLFVLCAALLIAVTLYAIVEGDTGILDSVLMLVRDVVAAILGWAIGRYGAH